jgi:tetratricopeptide (TPR) repeat protein
MGRIVRSTVISLLLGILLLPAWGKVDGLDTHYSVDGTAIRHFHEGQNWFERGRYEAAIKELQIAIRLKPNTLMTAALYNNLGLAYLKRGDYPLAVVSFQQAITLNPAFSLYYENLSSAYQQSGSVPKAIRQLQQAIQLNPRDETAWYLLGLLP